MKNEKGFTLIELMIVVAIIGIIASFATASYNKSAQKTKRADAKATLMNLSADFERCFSTNGQYTTTAAAPPIPAKTCKLVTDAGALEAVFTTSLKGHYTITLSGITPTSFGLTATPLNFVDTECTDFRLNNIGIKTGSGTLGNACW